MTNFLLFLDTIQISLIVMFVVLGILLIIFIIIYFTRKNKPYLEKIEPTKSLELSDDEFLNYIGGKENVISYKLIGSRLSLELKDYSKVNKEALKKANFEGIIEMKNKLILVKENLSEELKALDNLKL